MVVGIGPRVLSSTEKRIAETAAKTIEGKVTTAKEAFEYFAKNKGAVYTPSYKLPNGTNCYFTKGSGYGGDVYKHVKRTNGVTIDSHYFQGKNVPMTVTETCPNGSEIKHVYLDNYRGTEIKTPNGNIYGYKLKNGVKEYYKFVQDGWRKVEVSPKYLEAMYKNQANAARAGYAKVIS